MKIAIASGKGGTGKTLIATNLAVLCAEREGRSCYVDCDVEEPNGHIFLKPTIEKVEPIGRLVPEVDMDLCNFCGLCGKICQYKAIVSLGTEALVFPELCHSCGGCVLVCPTGAIREREMVVGELREGVSGGVHFIEGRLKISEAQSPPVIREVKKRIPGELIAFVDSPPGTSCPVIESVKNADFVLLVTEPTPFGLNDLKLAVEMVRKLNLPMGVVVNRSDLGYDEAKKFCDHERLGILMTLPDRRSIAKAYSRGEMLVEAFPEYRKDFSRLLDRIVHMEQKKGFSHIVHRMF